jgi:hypothetical protein
MTRLISPGNGAGAYLTGPVMPNPALLGYSAAGGSVQPSRPLAFPKTTSAAVQEPEITDQAVAEAIERLTKTPGSSPEALQQAALDMELVIKHFDSLSAIFGAEAALTSLALDLASNAEREAEKEHKATHAARTRARRTLAGLPTKAKTHRPRKAKPAAAKRRPVALA